MNGDSANRDGWKPLFRADWTRFVFLHYSLLRRELAPHTPFELDCREGQAFVSLVFFWFGGMRPARLFPQSLSRWLLRPVADGWFLNVRTYVRGPAGDGIQFLTEWMDNPISLHLGPLLYGLPYRRGRFDCETYGPDGSTSLRVTDAAAGASLHVSVGAVRTPTEPVAPGSLDEFLLEKHIAYTQRSAMSRFFRISHPHWQVVRPTVLAIDDGLIRLHCPWFKTATLRLAHASPGFQNVAMGRPYRVRVNPTAAENRETVVLRGDGPRNLQSNH
jgi:uncharacterized protein YqjF (DUF2071 family)